VPNRAVETKVLQRDGTSKVTRPPTKPEPNDWFWMGAAFAGSFALALLAVTIHGVNFKSLILALRLTGRWSFLPFWLAYAGGAMATLFGRTFVPLANRRRQFGLAYAAALSGHLGLIAIFYLRASHLPLSGKLLFFFLTAACWTYVLTLFSFGGLAAKLGAANWRALRFVGMNYILYAFWSDFGPATFHPGTSDTLVHTLAYTPFALMALAAPLLAVGAFVVRRWRTSRTGHAPSADTLATDRSEARAS